MPLTVVDCQVTTSSITITYSDPIATKDEVKVSVNGESAVPGNWVSSPGGGWLLPVGSKAPKPAAEARQWEEYKHSALNPNNYFISDPQSVDFAQGAGHPSKLLSLADNVPEVLGNPWTPSLLPGTPPPIPSAPPSWAWISVDNSRTKVTINFLLPPPPATGGPEFAPGSWISLVIRHVHGRPEAGDERPELEGDFVMLTRQVAGGKSGIERRTRDIEDAISYPLLTEEVGYPPSPVSRTGGGGGIPTGGGAQGLGQMAANAIGDVLGWKINASDAKGFIGSLTQSFDLVEVEGHVQHKWNQKSYTVQTDLAGGITGAQASLYARAQVARDNSLPLLDGLYALNPAADPEYVKALREMAKSQISEIVKQFGVVPPSILRVNTYFHILLGGERMYRFSSDPRVEADPDRIGGTLGSIRDLYGIYFQDSRGQENLFSNSVEDEQNITNFRVISDYMTSLLQSWKANGKYFELGVDRLPAFLGTQLILIGRQFNVIAETVNEVRFALDSVFIGPNERQQLLLQFNDQFQLPAMYLEDVLKEIEGTMTEEGPRLIKDGGRIAVNNNLLPVLQTLMNMIEGAHDPVNIDELPDGFRTARVRHALDDLRDQLAALFGLAQQVGINVPTARALAAASGI